MDIYEYNTLDASVNDETDFWTLRSYYFWIIALVSLIDLVTTLFILTTRYGGNLDSMLIEDIALLSYDLD